MRKFKQSVAIVLSVLMLLSVAMVGASAYEAVSVRGTFPGCDWDAGNAMELGQDGLYSFTFADVPVGNYQFKVVADGTWYGDNGNNFDVAVSEVGDVTVKFNPETNEISYTGGSAVTGLTVKTMQLMGFTSWEFATAPVMTETETGSGVYTYTAQNVAKGSYTYKFAANGDWAANWGAGADDEALSGDAIWNAQGNLSLYLEEAKDVTFTIDVSKFDYATKEGATYAVTLADATVEETSEASASEDVSSEAVASEDVSSEAVASEATSSEATSSEATSSEATSSEATSSEATSSEATSSEATSSEATSSEATSSETAPVETKTVLFTKPADWNAAYCHYWNNDGLTTAWPGIEMEYVGDNDFSQPQYKVDVDVRATSIIFHNNEGTQVEGKYTDGIEGYYVDNGELKFYPDVDIPTDPTEDPATVVPGYYLVGSPAICNGANWGWDKAWTTGTPKLTQSNDGSFYYYVAENVPSSADFVDDKGQPRYEAKVIYVDETGKVWWHPAGMGNNTYVPVEKDGSTVVFTFVQLTSRPDKDGSDPEAVAATVYGPEEEVPVVDTTVKPSESSASETSGSEIAGSETSGSEAAASEAGASEAPTPEAKTTITLKASTKVTATKKTTVKATVKNGKGSTTFKSSNAKVATVSSKGVVKGIKAGTVTITATNNGVKATVKIKVVKAANPMTVKGKTVKVKASAKKTTIKNAKAFTIKNAKGTVAFKKATGNKLITVSKKGVITVKKGLAKGKSYVVKVKVSAKGNGTYLAKTKTAKVTVKVTK